MNNLFILASKNLDLDEICNEEFDSEFGLLCQPYYECDICPARDQDMTCQIPVGFNMTEGTTELPRSKH